MLGVIGTSNAQIEEGNIMLGTDIGSGITNTNGSGLLGLEFGLNDGAGWNVGISPKVGYFLTDNFLLGAVVNLGYFKSAEVEGISSEEFIYGVQALSRFYVSPGDVDLEGDVPAGQFFLETQAGIAGSNVVNGETTNGFAFGFGPGYSLFLNESVALEASVKYNGLVGAGSTDYQNSLGLNLGIQIFIPTSDAENTIENFD
ncbi:hypothetical protein GCM10007103_04870 [Salinimicrobium marinum]|uniref:Outer membrane protein beta-barrel domain-containing protein n=2 Tax=Salinimicrobium marinum TaxID=680283 RepID=A0A918VVB0_9FLAO|nr:hypothetical protein GCM10007103_04870 [Salinimicrobium marinum]